MASATLRKRHAAGPATAWFPRCYRCGCSLPNRPHVFEAHVSVVCQFAQTPDDGFEVDGVFIDRGLQSARLAATGVEMGRVWQQDMTCPVVLALVDEMPVVERKRDSGFTGKAQGACRVGTDRTDVCLHRIGDSRISCRPASGLRQWHVPNPVPR